MTKITKLKTMLLTLLLCLVGVSEMQAYKVTLTLTNGHFSDGTTKTSYSPITGTKTTYRKIYGNDPSEGYSFSSWSVSSKSNCTATFSNSNSKDCQVTIKCTNAISNCSLTVQANYKANTYTVTFNPYGGTITNSGNIQNVGSDGCGSVTTTYDASSYCYMGSSGNPYRDGYAFAGWYDAADGGNQVYDAAGCCTSNGSYWSGSCTSSQSSWTPTWKHAGNVTLYAHWTPRNYVEVKSVTQSLSETDFTFYDPATRKLYNTTNQRIGNTTSGTYFDINLNVTAGDYQLTFKSGAGGGYAGTMNISLNANEGAAIDPNGDFTCPNNNSNWTPTNLHTFNITGLTDGGKYVRIMSKGNTNGDDCADLGNFQITKTKGFVTYDYNDGATASLTKTQSVGSTSTYDFPTEPTREGYSFVGWYEGETHITAETVFNRVDNPTLTAHWTGNVMNGDTKIEEGGTVTLEDDKNLTFNDGATVTVNEVSYTRKLTNNWGTICLPFEVKSEAGKVQYYKLKSVGSGVMTFEPVDNVAANTPAVFQRLNDKNYSATFKGEVELSGTLNEGESESTASDWKLVGTFKKTSISRENSNYYYIAQNKFWNATQATADIAIPAYRAYFEGPAYSNGAKAFTLAIWDGDSTTAIGTIDAEGDVKVITEGKFVQNGKVVIVKNGKKYNTAGQNIK